MFQELPPLNALRSFEAAARLQSITLAAQELYVTHGAISKQVRLLENFLGFSLFVRQHRQLARSQMRGDNTCRRCRRHCRPWPMPPPS